MNYILSTKDFLSTLYGEEKVTFRAIQEKPPGNKNHVVYSGYNQNFVDTYNKDCGIFFMVNQSRSESTKDTDIKNAMACFIDIDDDTLPPYFPVEPSAIISREDKKGHHVYWFLHPTEDIADWKRTQGILIHYYKSDGAIKNPARLMRLPGTINQKPKRNGQRYLIEKLKENRYDITEIITAHTDKKKILKDIKTWVQNLLKIEDFNMGDRGSVNSFMVKVVMRMHGHGFNSVEMFKLLKGINTKHFNNIFSDTDIQKRISARNYAKNKKGAELEESIEKELARQDRVEKALKDWYYVQIGNYFINVTEPRVNRTERGFNAEFAYVADIHNTAGYAFLHSLIKQAESLAYEPGEERILPGVLNLPNLNLWVDDRVKPDKTDHTWFLDHLEYLIRNEKEREHFLNWLAYAVQNPGAKIEHAVLIIGGQGVGKSILNELFENIFGPSNVNEPQNENLADKYTKWARNTCLCILNELKQADKYHFYNLIKPFITEKTISIREMHRDSYTINNHMNILAYSNEEVPIKLDKDDRRWFVIKSDAKRKPDTYYIGLARNIKENSGGAMNYLLKREVKDFNHGMLPATTEAKQFIINDSRPDLDLWIEEAIQYKNEPFKNDMVSISDIIGELPEKYRYNSKITNKYVAKLLRRHGAITIDKAIRINGEIKKYFIIRNHELYVELVEVDTKEAFRIMEEHANNELKEGVEDISDIIPDENGVFQD